MKKDLIFIPIMLIIGGLLFLLRVVGMGAHIGTAIAGLFVLAFYTAMTRREWKIPALEIIMRAFYGIALVTGVIVLKLKDIVALEIVHKASAALFIVLLVVLFVHKLIVNKKIKD